MINFQEWIYLEILVKKSKLCKTTKLYSSKNLSLTLTLSFFILSVCSSYYQYTAFLSSNLHWIQKNSHFVCMIDFREWTDFEILVKKPKLCKTTKFYSSKNLSISSLWLASIFLQLRHLLQKKIKEEVENSSSSQSLERVTKYNFQY